MGYYTYYDLRLKGASADDEQKIVERLRDMGIIGYALHEDLSCAGEATWYSQDEDMAKLSVEFPHIHFTMVGEGDNREDVWERHYLNGMTQELYAEITIPGLDPNNWREHHAVAGLRPKELPEFSTEGASLIDIMELG